MKKYLRLLFLIIFFIPLFNINALSNEEVNYKIKSAYIDINIRNNGDILVKELFTLEGSTNGFERNIELNKFDNHFSNNVEDFKSSDIYNASSIKDIRVGIIKDGKNPSFNSLTKKVIFFKRETAKNGDSNKYTKSNLENGYKIKVYDETINDTKSFYFEYIVTDGIVKHLDISELNLNILDNSFKESVEYLEMHISTPAVSKIFLPYAYGSLKLEKDTLDNKIFIIKVKDQKKEETLNARLLFDNELVKVIDRKISNVYALENIKNIEHKNELVHDAKKYRKELMYKIIGYTEYLYIGFIILCIIYVYIKYDKEYNSKWNKKYNKNLLDKYPLIILEYLMNKNITKNSFIASLLNLIYERRIAVDKYISNNTKKTDYVFYLLDDKDIELESDSKIINMLFTKRDKDKITMDELKEFIEQNRLKKKNDEVNDIDLWQKDALQTCEFFELYEDTKVPLYILIVITLVTLSITLLQILFDFNLSVLIFEIIMYALSIGYFLMVKKRTREGIEEYAKCKAMRRYIKDLNKLKNKDFPDISLWDKYIIYSKCFGLEEKTINTFKFSFEKYGVGYTGNIATVYNNCMLFDEINRLLDSDYKEVKKNKK